MTVKKQLGVLCVTVIAGVLVCTLWPFNPFPANQVTWLTGNNGVRFGTHGVITSSSPLLVPNHTASVGPCSLEIFLRPFATTRSDTILSFYSPDNPEQFRLRQWTDGLLVSRSFVDAHGRKKSAKLDVDHAFQVGKMVLLTISSGSSGTIVYLNGQQAQAFPRFTMTASDLSGQIVIGTSPVDYQPWPGELIGLAIYSRELKAEEAALHYQSWAAGGNDLPTVDAAIAVYLFQEKSGHEIHSSIPTAPDLQIPRRFVVPHKPMLTSPVREFSDSWGYVSDVLQNIFGFIPVGFALCAYLALSRSRGKAVLYAALSAGLLSFTIEFVQAYIPRRVSGVTDIITNTLGAAVGAWLVGPRSSAALLRMIDRVPFLGRARSSTTT